MRRAAPVAILALVIAFSARLAERRARRRVRRPIRVASRPARSPLGLGERHPLEARRAGRRRRRSLPRHAARRRRDPRAAALARRPRDLHGRDLLRARHARRAHRSGVDRRRAHPAAEGRGGDPAEARRIHLVGGGLGALRRRPLRRGLQPHARDVAEHRRRRRAPLRRGDRDARLQSRLPCRPAALPVALRRRLRAAADARREGQRGFEDAHRALVRSAAGSRHGEGGAARRPVVLRLVRRRRAPDRRLGRALRFLDPWPLFSDADRAATWRTGGMQPIALHAATGRLHVLVHQGGVDTHKEPGTDVFVYDVDKRERVQRIALRNPSAGFVLGRDEDAARRRGGLAAPARAAERRRRAHRGDRRTTHPCCSPRPPSPRRSRSTTPAAASSCETSRKSASPPTTSRRRERAGAPPCWIPPSSWCCAAASRCCCSGRRSTRRATSRHSARP